MERFNFENLMQFANLKLRNQEMCFGIRAKLRAKEEDMKVFYAYSHQKSDKMKQLNVQKCTILFGSFCTFLHRRLSTMLKKSLHQRCHFVPRAPNSSEIYLLYGRENTIKLCEKNYTFQGIKSLVSSLTQRDRERKKYYFQK